MEFNLELASCSDIGKIREKNEDSVIIAPELGLIAVADGMGGHNAGEVASNLAVSTLRDVVYSVGSGRAAIPADFEAQLPIAQRVLAYACHTANLRIFTLSKENFRRRGMGTTLSALLIGGGQNSAAAHIGDSRIYLFRGGILNQISRDHSYVQDQVDQGFMTKEEAASSRVQNVLTKAMGLKKEMRGDVFAIDPQPGDVYFLCSDGVNKGLSDEDIAKILSIENLSAGNMCRLIVKTSAQADGKDNVSCAILKIIAKPAKKGILKTLTMTLKGRKEKPLNQK